jgi:hypothetical protein
VNVDGADGSEKLRERSITQAFEKRGWLSLSEIVERTKHVWPRALNLCRHRRVERSMNTLLMFAPADSIAHTSTSDASGWNTIHPGMAGTVVVR